MALTTENKNEDPSREPAYHLEFEDLHVKRGKKPVLSGVSGIAEPGGMLALMGPSGAGKSTLLNVLAGRSPSLTSGCISLNGTPLNKQLIRKISYVLQDDIFFERLTMRETLTYAALLKLPEKMKMKDKLARVEEIAEALEIKRCLDTIIGDDTHKGLSGGEKKRTSIACELLSNPSLLMLDEPTSGLDSNAAYALMETLKNYALTSRKTVVASIHQPSSQVFFMFDRVLLLCDGQTAYFGDCNNILNFFASVNLHCEPTYNPADFILEKVKESESVKVSLLEAAKKQRYSVTSPDILKSNEENSGTKAEVCDKGYSNGAFNASSKSLNFRGLRSSRSDSTTISVRSMVRFDGSRVKLQCHNDAEDNCADSEVGPKWPTTFFTQFRVLLKRSSKHVFPRIFSLLTFLQTAIMSVICGLVWFQLEKSESRITERLGVCFFFSTYWAFSPSIDVVLAFPIERRMLNKERAAGYYRLSAFYLAKTFSEVPLVMILPSVFVTILYWMAGLRDYIAFFKTWALVVLETFTSQSIGYFFAALITDVDVALKSVIIYMLCSLLAGGYFVKTAAAWSYWLKYLSYLHYTFSGLVTFEFKDRPLSCMSANKTSFCTSLYQNDSGSITTSGLSLLHASTRSDEQRTDFTDEKTFNGTMVLDSLGLSWEEWLYPMVLFGFAFTFRLLAYLALRFSRKS